MTIPDPPRKVLTVDAVRRSIETLHKPFIHEQFIAYLHIRKRGVEDGSMIDIEPRWGDVSALLAVDGGPPNKPHYRPVSSRTKHDPAGYWLNPNIPGSYAPKSLRSVSRFMLDSAGNFTLPNDHAQQSLVAHLKGKRQPAWPFAGYFLRNYSFDPSAATASDLIEGFRHVFRFDATGPGTDFDVLFTIGDEPDIEWFEPLTAATTEEVLDMDSTLAEPEDD
ncbi:hypothetical protein M2359_000858 [Gordonia amarae]|uniref:Uncharacterized protein n=1 Tax=Gordonia amarae NBRC 15530 TaxID=1075090 RepID=G7GN30_9ACTN|nr:hypothetical protein [Gordonia amarae]MCS3877229.1 hypothetical protein [Gordonia amarae]GAB05005.1 hypothetical protein GOAMR_25_00420 [Gordonia amarae NBRC 15530]